MKSRQKEVAAAEKIVEHELGQWSTWARGLNVNPTIVALRAKTKGVLVAELERTLGRLKHLSEGDRAAFEQMIESATNKLLHAPTTRLKQEAGASDGNDLVRAAQQLFDLPSVPPPEPSARSVAPPSVDSSRSVPPPATSSEKRLPH